MRLYFLQQVEIHHCRTALKVDVLYLSFRIRDHPSNGLGIHNRSHIFIVANLGS